MCEQCEANRKATREFTRRAMLAAAAGTAGTLAVGVFSCQRTVPYRPTKGGIAQTQATPATMRIAATAPAPDLGAVLFPDAAGRPLAQAADAPVIVIPRRQWTATHPDLTDIQVMDGVHRITVHHTAWMLDTDAWRPTANELEQIREFHAGDAPHDRHWADIGYHFVVDRAGRVWQARPLAYQGAHVHLRNAHNMGIVLLGNFDVQWPSAAQLVALRRFIRFVRGLYGIAVSEIFTHRELALNATDCPGTHLQAFMDRARKRWALTARHTSDIHQVTGQNSGSGLPS